MQQIIFEKPYKFVPPAAGTFWPLLLRQLAPLQLKRQFGITAIEFRGEEQLQESISSGRGVLLAPNHSHPADPFVLIELGRRMGFSPYIMASWHLFMKSWLQTWLLRHGRVFSVYREGLDRQALSQAIDILDQGPAPLVIFPEGVISRHNDRLNPLMDGVALIAKSAAKKRAARQSSAGVVVHPVSLKYDFRGDVSAAVAPVLSRIEDRLTWEPQPGKPLKERIIQIGSALLALKEIEHIGEPQAGSLAERVQRLIDHLLCPLEAEWAGGKRENGTVARVKRLRAAVLPDMVQGELAEPERARRWVQLKAMYLAQQLHSYPPDYIAGNDNPNRMLETVERFEEDLTDHCTVYIPRIVTVTIGAGIDVGDGSAKRGAGLIDQVETRLAEMLKSE